MAPFLILLFLCYSLWQNYLAWKFKEGRVSFDSWLKVSFIIVEKAWSNEHEWLITYHSQSRGKERWMLLFISLSSYHSAKDSSLWNERTKINSKSSHFAKYNVGNCSQIISKFVSMIIWSFIKVTMNTYHHMI